MSAAGQSGAQSQHHGPVSNERNGILRRARAYTLTAVLIGTATLAVSQAGAWTPDRGAVLDRRAHVQELRKDKCLRLYETSFIPRDLSAYWLKRKWETWGQRKERTRAKSSKCVPTNPTAIVRYVFPSYAEDQALRVAGCESTGVPYRLNPYAKNPYSSAAGLFQLLDTWYAGRFNPYNALANTRMAYQLWLGSGGSFAQHWAASVGCWG